MTSIHCPVLAAIITAAGLGPVAVAQSLQIGPSVLDLQRSFHAGAYSVTIDVPTGAVSLLAQHGTLDMFANGSLGGGLDTWEWTGAGVTFTPNDPVSGRYFVAPDERIEFDFDPLNPGTDVFEAWIAPDGAALHMARYQLDTEAISVLALAKSTGQSVASLNGTYRLYGQRVELAAGGYETTAENGTAVFDGAGNATFTGTELFVPVSGAGTTSPASGAATYTVANDGALTLGNSVGGIDATGEVFFLMTASTTSSEVGMEIGVRVGSSLSLAALDGIYTYAAQTHELGAAVGLPRTATDVGRLTLTASTATLGGYDLTGQTFFGRASGLSAAPRTIAGAATFANGVMTLAGGPPIELAFSASGRYAVGRAVDNHSDLWFAMRGCAECNPYGIATAGSNGIEPELGMRTFPTLGNANWRFAITDGLSGAPAVLALGFVPAPGIPFAGGLLWLDPTRIVASPFLVLGGPPGIPGGGSVDVPLPIPPQVQFLGPALLAQALVLDPAAPATIAMSRGFRVVISRP